MDKDYVNRKIEKCEKLVKAATSEDQKKIYQGYLDYWNNFLDPDPEPLLQKKLREAKEAIDAISLEAEEAEFKTENPNKKAYYSRNGETHITKAFKEFLNQRTK
jgi:deoxyribodipyrimidine photolyase